MAPRRADQRTRRRLPRWPWITAVVLLGVALVVIVAGLPLYVFPPHADVAKADVLFVIGPPTPDRLRAAERLRDAGVADRVLVSVPGRGGAPWARGDDYCARAYVTCATPSPFTTKGEAQLLTDYDAEHGTRSAVVLTFTPHVSRTRFVFAKCHVGEVTVEEVPAQLDLSGWVYQYAYQTAGFLKALVQGCPGTGPESRP